jgi:ferrous iron transport protein B
MLILAATLFLMFQAVFSLGQAADGLIKERREQARRGGRRAHAGYHPAQLAGRRHHRRRRQRAGVPAADPDSVPFILALEDSGYLPRAAFLLDRLMGTVGLSGRSFIPLLSSFACAIPGIMARAYHQQLARPAVDDHDRTVDDLFGAAAGVRADHRRLHPEITCRWRLQSAGAGAVRPLRRRRGRRMAVAGVLKHTVGKGMHHPLMLELPSYRVPHGRNLLLGLLERARIFMRASAASSSR